MQFWRCFSFYIWSIDSLNLVSLQVARSWSQFLIVSKNQLLTGILKSVFKFCFVKNWLIPLESSFIHCNLEIPESTYLGFQSFICLKICLFDLYWKYGLSLWTIPRHRQDSIFMILNILQIFYNFKCYILIYFKFISQDFPETHCVAEVKLEILNLPLISDKCWHYRRVRSCSGDVSNGIQTLSLMHWGKHCATELYPAI